MTDWKAFFEQLKHQGMDGRFLPSDTECVFWEDLYQAFKARMAEEDTENNPALNPDIIEAFFGKEHKP